MGASKPHPALMTASSSSAAVPLFTRPLLSLLLLLAGGVLLLCLLEVRTLTSDGALPQSAGVSTSSTTARPLSQAPPAPAFRPLHRLANQRAAATTERQDDPWVSPLSSVHSWPPASPTASTYRWKSHPTPLWQMVIEQKGQTVDFASIGIRNGRLVFYGLSGEQRAELLRWFEPFMHFDGTTARLDRVEDVTEFVDAPLDWATCGAVQSDYSLFVTPWMTMMYYHVVCEHLINAYANMRSANALPQRLLSNHSSSLAYAHPRSLFYDPLPPFDSSPDTLSPFTSPHLSADSVPHLYTYTRWNKFEASAGLDLLYSLFDGHVSPFSDLESNTLTCFRRVRFGRGIPLHYMAHVYPFRLPPAAPVWSFRYAGNGSAPLDSLHATDADPYSTSPAIAAQLAASQLEQYTTVELGRWAGVLIDFYNYLSLQQGRARRVREGRDPVSHEPIRGLEVAAPQSPNILLLTRGRSMGRFIANPQCIIDAAAARNLTVVECCNSQAPFVQQQEWYQQADILVGLHGAGFTNLLWMAPGGLVVEVKTHYNPDNRYFEPLGKHLDHAYSLVDGRAFHKGEAGYHFTDEWCAQLVRTVHERWQWKHSEAGRFENVYGVGNLTFDWMLADNKPLDKATAG